MTTQTCSICPHVCRLAQGEVGMCGARQEQNEVVVPLNYGRCTALALDPIEKKPLARFMPKSLILSYGSFGCNLSCPFCQNWEIAQAGKGTNNATGASEGLAMSRYISPLDLVEQAVKAKPQGNIGIALTYNEPLVCPEYILDVARLAHAEELKLVLVTNGYVMQEVARHVFAQVDAANIDLKAFSQELYTKAGAPAGLTTVMRTIQIAYESGCHVEITTLIIPGLNDSAEEMEKESAWLASLDPDIPLHISRFHPAYNMTDTDATSRNTIYELEQVAKRNLRFVYTGNM